MTIKAVIVCVRYDDLLEYALPTIRPHVEAAVVITTPWDTATREIAQAGGASVYVTKAFYSHGAAFNKGAALNEYIALAPAPWILLADADTALPHDTRSVIEANVTEPHYLYGARRFDCPTREAWVQVGAGAGEWNIRSLQPTPDKDELPGYFQLFRPEHIEPPLFNEAWQHAGGYDTEFQKRYGPNKRRLPIDAVHLGEHRENWHGRRSARWTDRPASEGGPDREQIERAHESYRTRLRQGVSAYDIREAQIGANHA